MILLSFIAEALDICDYKSHFDRMIGFDNKHACLSHIMITLLLQWHHEGWITCHYGTNWMWKNHVSVSFSSCIPNTANNTL